MITHFKIKNFTSILDVDVNLEFAEGKAPNGFQSLNKIIFLEPIKKQRYIPSLAIFGANASGKSNIILAFEVLKKIVESGIENKFYPNKVNRKYKSTTFNIGLIIGKTLYDYTIEYNQDEILNETLFKDDDIVYEISRKKKIFNKIVKEPVYNVDFIKNVFKVQCCNDKKQQIRPLLSVIAKDFTGLNEHIIKIYGKITNKIFICTNDDPMQTETADERTKTFDRAVDIIKNLDIDIERMELKHENSLLSGAVSDIAGSFVDRNNNRITVERIKTYHKDTEGKDVQFGIREESYGTRILIGLIRTILTTLDNGATLIIDELDKSLHSLILMEVVKIFKDKDYNKNNSQIIFTLHNTDILDSDVLRLSEIGIVNKNLENGTTLKRLSDQEGIRNVTNFRKQYLEGVFSGIPFPYI